MKRARWWLICGLLAAAAGARASTAADLTQDQYRDRLAALERELDAGDTTAAAEHARALLDDRVRVAGETVATDGSLLRPMVLEPDRAARLLPRLRALIAALETDSRSTEGAQPAADRDLLARLSRPSEPDRQRGGELGKVRPLELSQRLERLLRRVGHGIAALFERLARWLGRLRPPSRGGSGPFPVGPATFALMAVVAATLGLFAFRALRDPRRGPTPDLSEPTGAASRDADPISREADEWLTYADELARRGRHREALRAWYHAVLVTLFRNGMLHYQKGRTNWEYVSGLGPELLWRPAFVAMTRQFDREWYGRQPGSAASFRAFADQARHVLRAQRIGEPA